MEKFGKIVARAFNIDEESISLDMTPEDLDSWTSVSHFQLIAMIEDAYGIIIEVEEMGDLTSLRRIRRLIGLKGVTLP